MFDFSNKKLIVLIIILIAPLSIFEESILHYFTTKNIDQKIQTITISGQKFNLEFADTEQKREQGLSGRASLPKDSGLLFTFDKPDYHGFWMKDMKFPIDIVWLNDKKEMLSITRNLQPKSYPKIFYPPQEVRYVLEINTGIIP